MTDIAYVDPFVLKADAYKREIDPVGQYITSAAQYLSTMTDRPLEDCRQYVIKNLRPDGKFPIYNRPVEYFERGENLDRTRKTTGVLNYIKDTLDRKHILAPTWTSYKNIDQEESIPAIEINVRKARRGVAKKKGAAAEAAKDYDTAVYYNGMQTQMKRSNNSLSGAAVTQSTPLYNKTSHPTLTTTCRITSGNGNACNEKLLSGNRHYWSLEVVINDITAIITHTDYALLEKVMAKYNLVYPDAEQTFQVVRYSKDLYWRSEKDDVIVREYVSRLTAAQRATFVYTGDLYQVLQFNPGFMREFLDKLTRMVYREGPEPEKYIHKASELMLSVAHQLCTDIVKGIGKDYTKLKNPNDIYYIYGTIRNLEDTFTEYADFVELTMRSKNSPASLAVFPDSVRRAAITSDTDSTIFTVQDWIIWYMGGIDFSPKGVGTQAVLTYITSAATVHVLAMMSANMGIHVKHVFEINMKPEFRFDVFVPTAVAKTYYAAIGCKEGNVYEKHKLEIKGVMLKSSANPPEVNKAAEQMIQDVCDTILAGKKISIMEMLKRTADMEREIIDSIARGETKYLKSGTIKDTDSYDGEPDETPYATYLFWSQTFATKYGQTAPPPYSVNKISLNLPNPRAIRNWLADMEDKALAAKLSEYFVQNKKTRLTTLHIQTDYLVSHGLPVEIMSVIDRKKIAGELCKSLYLILETLGYYGYQKKLRRLVSDTIVFDAA